jgi:hypothetical protein
MTCWSGAVDWAWDGVGILFGVLADEDAVGDVVDGG